jgi:hypothetical protein
MGQQPLGNIAGDHRSSVDQQKRDKILDILRRVIANPFTAPEVASELSLDWNPMIVVDSKGNIDFRVGSGKKR